MQYDEHRKSAMSWSIVIRTLPNACPELAESISLVQVLFVWPFVNHLTIFLDAGAADLVQTILVKVA
jgi:hypothetical protein